MLVGVTGTTMGATPEQEEQLRYILGTTVTVLHHGDAFGVDALAFQLFCTLRTQRQDSVIRRVVMHPPSQPDKRAFTSIDPLLGDEMRPEAPYLIRDRAIVNETELLVAVPASPTEQLRSGTWATVRYARRAGRLIIRINPDGTIGLG